MADLLEKRGNTVQFIAWKQEDQFQVAVILYKSSYDRWSPWKSILAPLPRGAMLEPFYAALKDYSWKKMGLLNSLLSPMIPIKPLTVTEIQPVKSKPILWIP